MTNTRQTFYKKYIRPALFKMDPEDAHGFAHSAMPWLRFFEGPARRLHSMLPASLSTEIAGTKFSNPVGLAAGFDKNGKLTEYLRIMGFGFAEIGSITGQPAAGNPRPRLFRLPEDKAIINYMGLNGEGAEAVAMRLSQQRFSLPVAVNIAKTNHPSIVGDKAIEDIVSSFSKIKELPLAYVAINVSCPNTHESKLAEVGALDTMLQEIAKLNHRPLPLFVKLSPDSDRELLEQVVSLGSKHKLAGYICGNTTMDRSTLTTPAERLSQIGPGGMSGPPLRDRALKLCQQVFELKDPNQQIIACGGITSGADAYTFIKAGASAIEIYTALVYEGPFLPFAICRELAEILKRENTSLKDAVGQASLTT